MATLAAQITSAGITAPSYADVFQELRIAYWGLYGSDANLEPDSQDGQWLAVLSKAIDDTNKMAIAVYNSYSPAFAQGAGLAIVVKINGLRKLVPTPSQVVVTIGGQVGTQIFGGLVGDNLNLKTQWALPALVTIPVDGTIDVTATCVTPGATAAGIGTLTVKLTPTAGWQTVTNAAAATPGSPVETDAALRRRQSVSTSVPALTIAESIFAEVANLPGVQRVALYINDTDVTDANGIQSHSICVVAQGGIASDIAAGIAAFKSPGTGTFGNISIVVIDQNGVPDTINFFQVQFDTIVLVVTIKALPGYVSSTGDLIKAALVDYMNRLDIGEDSYLARVYAPASLTGNSAIAVSGKTQTELDVLSNTFKVNTITQDGVAADRIVAFNHGATTSLANITLNVV